MTLKKLICGNYDSDACWEWGNVEYTKCEEGETCQDAKCVSCENYWECEEWGACISGVQKRLCKNSKCDVPDKTETRICECVENWKCSWTICTEGDEYSYPYDCFDLSNCGNENFISKIKCTEPIPENLIFKDSFSGSSDVSCSVWGICEAVYTLSDVLNEDISQKGWQKRTCTASDGDLVIESQPCTPKINIKTTRTKWCLTDYVEVSDKITGELVCRLKESEIPGFDLTRLDVAFVYDEFTGYCDYCYDEEKNYDEENLDCGGPSCPACLYTKPFFNWVFWLALILWIIFILLLVKLVLSKQKKIKTKTSARVFNKISEKVKQIPRPNIKPFIAPIKKIFKKKQVRFAVPKFKVPVKKIKLHVINKEKLHKRFLTSALAFAKKKKKRTFVASDKANAGISQTKSNLWKKAVHVKHAQSPESKKEQQKIRRRIKEILEKRKSFREIEKGLSKKRKLKLLQEKGFHHYRKYELKRGNDNVFFRRAQNIAETRRKLGEKGI